MMKFLLNSLSRFREFVDRGESDKTRNIPIRYSRDFERISY